MNAPMLNGTPQPEGGAFGSSQVNGENALLDIDPIALLRALQKRWGVIASITLGLTALVFVGVSQLTPLYTAETLIILNQQTTRVTSAESVLSGLESDSPTVDSQVEILRSRSIARKVVEDLNLIDDPEFNGALRPVSVMRWIDPRSWINLLASKAEDLSPAQTQEVVLNRIVNAVVNRTEVTRRGLTYIMSLQFTSEDPEKAARIANALADVYVVDQLEAKFDATKKANEWLSSRLETLRSQVEASERAVEIYRRQNGLENIGGTTINDQQLSELNAQLILARTNYAEKQAKYARARQILTAGGSIESVADVVQSQTISTLRGKEADLARQQADLSSKYGPRHPSILNIDAQRKDIQRQIGSEVQRIVGSIQNEATIAQSRVDALQNSLNELKGTASENNQALVQLRELEREADANKTIYESFLNRFKETSQQGDLQTSDARVISVATRPLGASSPKKNSIVLAAFALSGLLGVLVALLLNRLDNGLRTSQEIEAALGVAHLVSVPLVPDEKRPDGKQLTPQDYLLSKPLSAYSESFRSLRSALALSNVDVPPKLLLFTSSLPNEGKTTTSVSFARAAAESGLRVILIDCDLRHPSVHRAFGSVSPKFGLVELLAGRATLDDAMVVDAASSLHYIPVASGSANPPDILASAQMKRVLMEMRAAYDLVVLDSAPVLPVSDSRVLSRLVDKTIFVVRWTETPKDAAISGIRELRNYGADIAGVVLSAVDTVKQARYGYGDGGYYYKKYSKYYVN